MFVWWWWLGESSTFSQGNLTLWKQVQPKNTRKSRSNPYLKSPFVYKLSMDSHFQWFKLIGLFRFNKNINAFTVLFYYLCIFTCTLNTVHCSTLEKFSNMHIRHTRNRMIFHFWIDIKDIICSARLYGNIEFVETSEKNIYSTWSEFEYIKGLNPSP